MLSLPASTKVWLAADPVDMRKGIDGLFALARRVTDADPFGGHAFVFLSRRRDSAKVLLFDHGGFVLVYKRLEGGRFIAAAPAAGERAIVVSSTDLQMLLAGIDWRSVRRTRLWQPNRSLASGGSTSVAA